MYVLRIGETKILAFSWLRLPTIFAFLAVPALLAIATTAKAEQCEWTDIRNRHCLGGTYLDGKGGNNVWRTLGHSSADECTREHFKQWCSNPPPGGQRGQQAAPPAQRSGSVDTSSFRLGASHPSNWAFSRCDRDRGAARDWTQQGFASKDACLNAHIAATRKMEEEAARTNCDTRYCYPQGRPTDFQRGSWESARAMCAAIDKTSNTPYHLPYGSPGQCAEAVRAGRTPLAHPPRAQVRCDNRYCFVNGDPEKLPAGTKAWALAMCGAARIDTKAPVYSAYRDLDACVASLTEKKTEQATAQGSQENRPRIRPEQECQRIEATRLPKWRNSYKSLADCLARFETDARAAASATRGQPEAPGRGKRYEVDDLCRQNDDEGKACIQNRRLPNVVYYRDDPDLREVRFRHEFAVAPSCKFRAAITLSRTLYGKPQLATIYVHSGDRETIECGDRSCPSTHDRIVKIECYK